MLEGYPAFIFCLMITTVVILVSVVVWLKGRLDSTEKILEKQVDSVDGLYERLAEKQKELDSLKSRVNDLETQLAVIDAYVNCMFRVNVTANSAMMEKLRRKENENSRRSQKRKK